MAELALNEDMLRSLTTEAIMGYLTPERREALMKEAISKLLESTSGRRGDWWDGMIRQEIATALQKSARIVLSDDPTIRAELADAVRGGIAQWLQSGQGRAEAVSTAVAKALSETQEDW